MPTEVILPKVDMDMATGRISRWFYKEGDAIRKGEPLFEIETDKAAMEVDAPAGGTLRNVMGPEGVDIAVGAPVAWIYAEGEVPEAPAAEAPKPKIVGPDPDVETDSPSPDANQAAALAGQADADGSAKTCGSCSGDGATGRKGVRATPLARRIARERGVDLARVTGRGPLGRIQRDDVERALSDATAAAADAAGRPPRDDRAPSPDPRIEQPAPAALRTSAVSARGSGVSTSNEGAPLHLVTLRDGEGASVVLIHGFGSESASWRPLLAELGELSAPVIGVDLAGHGGSVGREAHDFQGLVSDVEDSLTAAGLTSCHLVGHSLGGAVAAAVAAGIAVDVRSLMLVAPAGFGPDIDTGFAEGFARATEEPPVRSWLRHLVVDPASLSDSFVRAAARSRSDGRHAEAQTRLVPRLFSNGTQHFDVRASLADLAMPVKIVAGAQDKVVPVRHFHGLPGMIALHVFPRTGHLPQIERRTEVARLLRQLVR